MHFEIVSRKLLFATVTIFYNNKQKYTKIVNIKKHTMGKSNSCNKINENIIKII